MLKRIIYALLASNFLLLNAFSSPPNIFGKDDRQELLFNERPNVWVLNVGQHCTGALVWHNLMLTASHCLFEDDGSVTKDQERFKIYRNFSAGEYIKVYRIKRFWSVSNIREGSIRISRKGRIRLVGDYNLHQDWSIAEIEELDDPKSRDLLPFERGYFDVVVVPEEDLKGMTVSTAGFGRPFRDEYVGSIKRFCKIRNTIRVSDRNIELLTDCDIVGGDSGSPLWRTVIDAFGNIAYQIVGVIHTALTGPNTHYEEYADSVANVASASVNFIDILKDLQKIHYRKGIERIVCYRNGSGFQAANRGRAFWYGTQPFPDRSSCLQAIEAQNQSGKALCAYNSSDQSIVWRTWDGEPVGIGAYSSIDDCFDALDNGDSDMACVWGGPEKFYIPVDINKNVELSPIGSDSLSGCNAQIATRQEDLACLWQGQGYLPVNVIIHEVLGKHGFKEIEHCKTVIEPSNVKRGKVCSWNGQAYQRYYQLTGKPADEQTFDSFSECLEA